MVFLCDDRRRTLWRFAASCFEGSALLTQTLGDNNLKRAIDAANSLTGNTARSNTCSMCCRAYCMARVGRKPGNCCSRKNKHTYNCSDVFAILRLERNHTSLRYQVSNRMAPRVGKPIRKIVSGFAQKK